MYRLEVVSEYEVYGTDWLYDMVVPPVNLGLYFPLSKGHERAPYSVLEREGCDLLYVSQNSQYLKHHATN